MEGINGKEILGVDEVKSGIPFFQAVIVEFLATAFFTLLGIASTAPMEFKEELGIAVCFGFLYTALVLIFGPISGCQVNPAVTIGFMCIGQTSVIRGFLYIIVQYLGALVGAASIYRFLKDQRYIIVNRLKSPNMKPGQGIFFEAMITMLLVLVCLAVTDKNRPGLKSTAAVAMGLAICAGHLAALRFTGAGMNPARSFAPAAINNSFKEYYIYFVGPCLGGIVAALIYRIVLKPYFSNQDSESNKLYEYNWC